MEQRLPDSSIVETNTYYEGDRYTTEKHRGYTWYKRVDFHAC